MKIDQYFKHYGLSRRIFFEDLKSGHIAVNGHVVHDMSRVIKPYQDAIFYKGKRVKTMLNKVVYIFHKPKDLIVTSTDPKNRQTIEPYLSKIKESVFPIGRLDRQTTGLLLLTNDGLLAKQIMHPSFKLPKTYNVSLDLPLTSFHAEQLRQGVMLEDGPAYIESLSYAGKDLTLVVTEGRNRLIRRLFALFGYQVLKLKRTHIAFLGLEGLPLKGFKKLTESQIDRLKSLFDN